MLTLQNRFAVLGDPITTGNGATSQIQEQLDINTFDRALTKTYYKLIQATHHMDKVETSINTNIFPSGMLKQVKLAQFIKPFSPTEQTKQKINNNNNWMKHNVYIVQEHYTQTIIQLMEH